MNSKERNQALLNGALISIGLIAILDNIISHWIFKWHRIIPDETFSIYLEITLFTIGIILLIVGMYREIRIRKK